MQLQALTIGLLWLGSTFFGGSHQTAQQIKHNQALTKAPTIEFAATLFDFGTIKQGAPAATDFEFKNAGTAPLILSNVKSSCGCTVPSYSREPVLPGELGKIRVRYDSKRVGPFQKSVTVQSNDPNTPTLVLRIKGNVLPDDSSTSN